MADAPVTPGWVLPKGGITQAPFIQSWNGVQAPFANTQDQIQQSLQISGVYPGQMPPNAFLGNTPARYAFGRTVPGTSPYVGALLNYMQGSGMPPTGVNMSTLGLQNGTGQVPPPSGGPPYGTPYGPGTFPAPGQGGPNVSPPGNPAPPPGQPISDPGLGGPRGGLLGPPTAGGMGAPNQGQVNQATNNLNASRGILDPAWDFFQQNPGQANARLQSYAAGGNPRGITNANYLMTHNGMTAAQAQAWLAAHPQT